MKLRIRGNSIRLRLTKSEVDLFQTTGKVEDCIVFGPHAKLTYILEKADCELLNCVYDTDNIRILVPITLADNWTNTEQVGMSDESKLKILVEKDFQCLTSRGAEDADTFPNPNM